MKYNTAIIKAMQTLLTNEEAEKLAEAQGYHIEARKLTVYDLLKYLVIAAQEQTKSFRETVNYAKYYGVTPVSYSKLSTKASDVPYQVFKDLFHMLLKRCNRRMKRILGLEKSILAVDSTTITTSESQLKWAGFHGKRAGVKLHVQFNVATYEPTKVEESIAKNHDFPEGKKLENPDCIFVGDRGYSKIEQFDQYEQQENKQLFVIRIKENMTLVKAKSIKRLIADDSNVIKDITCQLGKKEKLSKNRFRVVVFNDYKGKEIYVCTNIMHVSSETIAAIYKARWTIETFFRLIKQNLNVSKIFGTTQNSVYNQLYAALICFVIIKFLYMETSKTWVYAKLSLSEFIRKLCLDSLCTEVCVSISALFSRLIL